MKQCQICGHEEDLRTCPKCGRHTCESCFKIQKKSGYSKKDCLYCGYEFKPKVEFIPPKRIPREQPTSDGVFDVSRRSVLVWLAIGLILAFPFFAGSMSLNPNQTAIEEPELEPISVDTSEEYTVVEEDIIREPNVTVVRESYRVYLVNIIQPDERNDWGNSKVEIGIIDLYLFCNGTWLYDNEGIFKWTPVPSLSDIHWNGSVWANDWVDISGIYENLTWRFDINKLIDIVWNKEYDFYGAITKIKFYFYNWEDIIIDNEDN